METHMDNSTEYTVTRINFVSNDAFTLANFRYYCDACEYMRHYAKGASNIKGIDMVVFVMQDKAVLKFIKVTDET